MVRLCLRSPTGRSVIDTLMLENCNNFFFSHKKWNKFYLTQKWRSMKSRSVRREYSISPFFPSFSKVLSSLSLNHVPPQFRRPGNLVLRNKFSLARPREASDGQSRKWDGVEKNGEKGETVKNEEVPENREWTHGSTRDWSAKRECELSTKLSRIARDNNR